MAPFQSFQSPQCGSAAVSRLPTDRVPLFLGVCHLYIAHLLSFMRPSSFTVASTLGSCHLYPVMGEVEAGPPPDFPGWTSIEVGPLLCLQGPVFSFSGAKESPRKASLFQEICRFVEISNIVRLLGPSLIFSRTLVISRMCRVIVIS